jgi:hypothetical protein
MNSTDAVLNNRKSTTRAVSLEMNISPGAQTTTGVIDSGILGQTSRVSISSDGIQGNNDSFNPVISGNGRYIAFSSIANNLVVNDTNNFGDVFVYDQLTQTTNRVSISSSGVEGNNNSPDSSDVGILSDLGISRDGRYITFSSRASNLVANDTNNSEDVFVHDQLTGTTSRVSISSNGIGGNGASSFPSISGDGRYVAFQSLANNLVANDTNNFRDIFVHDLQTGITSLVSLNSTDIQGNGGSFFPSISGDGRYVAFQSIADNLVANDTNNQDDIFVRDRQTGITSRVSVSSNGVEGNNFSDDPSISEDGGYVAFVSTASNLVPNDTNGVFDVFLHDLQTATTSLLSIDSTGIQGNNISGAPSISQDGQYVTFVSAASNLVPNDTNAALDIFVYNRQTQSTSLVSVDSDGILANNSSTFPSISGDGRYVAFASSASNLVPNDTNNRIDIFVYDRGITGLINGSFEAGDSSNWETTGDINIRTTDIGVNPTDGLFQAFITNGLGTTASDNDLEAFLGLASGTLDNLGNGNAIQGSAIKQTFTALAGDTLTFDWNFFTNESTPSLTSNDFAFYTIDFTPSAVELADTTSPNFSRSSVANYIKQTGYQTVSINISQTGTYTLGLGVVDVDDDIVNSALVVDNVQLI